MIGQGGGRRAYAQITIGGADITAQLQRYITSVVYSDNEEDWADDLQINMHDRGGLWLCSWLQQAIEAASPGGGGLFITAAFVRHGYPGDGNNGLMLDCGSFELDAVVAKGPPSTVTLKSTSLPFGTGARQTEKNREWGPCALSDIASAIAAEAGMGFLFESGSDPRYERQEQARESDVRFLSRLCHDAGLALKATGESIVLFDQAEYESRPPVMTFVKGDGTYCKWALESGAAGASHTACRVCYTEPGTGNLVEGYAYAEGYDEGDPGPLVLEVSAKVKDAAEAALLAEKRLRRANRFGMSAHFEMPGEPRLMAGLTVALEGWGPWNGAYMVSQARHEVGAAGYTTNVKLRQALGAL